MELFACGHEFAHHALQHDPTSTDLSSEEAREDEYAADHFARVISKHVGRRREPPLEHATSGVGGVIVLKSLELIVRVQTVLLTGVDCVPAVASHPTVSDRIHRFGEADAEERADLQERFSMLRNHFVAIFDQLWWSIRPAIFEVVPKKVFARSSSEELLRVAGFHVRNFRHTQATGLADSPLTTPVTAIDDTEARRFACSSGHMSWKRNVCPTLRSTFSAGGHKHVYKAR